ncbi:MAG: protein phosphatase 2C domain-containing protein [Lachnospiraceae bacterium]|nr:protein phosphatase 2C domain-containing protein [Lachnospiraceae bacterium]
MPQQSYHIASVQGIGTRARQEDSFAYVNDHNVKVSKEKGLLFVVCDGMGGMRDGKVASETAITYIVKNFENMNVSKNIAAQLKQSVYESSAEVEKLLEGQGGSTAVTCMIYDDGLYYASVGDSFLFLKRGEDLFQLNTEHNLRNQMYDEAIMDGELDPEPARVHPDTAALTQFLGYAGLSEIDGSVRPMKLHEGDVLLACSDGVGGVLSEEEIKAVLSYPQPEMMCAAIERSVLAHKKKNQDNYTAIVVKCVV